MKTIFRIARLELSLLFYSPIAWVVIVIFMITVAFGYTNSLAEVEKLIRFEKLHEFGSTYAIFLDWETGFVLYLLYGLAFFIPLLTMGLISKELSSGTIKLVLSSPIKPHQLVLGKYLAIVIYCSILTLCLLILMIIHSFIGQNPDIGLMAACLLSFFLLAITYAAIGLFISSLTSYQTVAAVVTLAALMGLDFLAKLSAGVPFLRDVTYWIKIRGRAYEAAKGLYSSETIFYFLIISLLFIGFAIAKIYSSRSSASFLRKTSPYFLLVLGAGILGYLTSLPTWTKYMDFTATQRNTLSDQSRELLGKIDGPIKITAYANILDHLSTSAAPSRQVNDKAHFNGYRRFIPHMEMDYVFYYDTIRLGKSIFQRAGKSIEETAKDQAKMLGIDFGEVLTPEQIKDKIDLSPEDNRFVRAVQYNGKTAILRAFDDRDRNPEESATSAAIKRLLTKPPKIVFTADNGERGFKRYTDKDYYYALTARLKRHSLINDGFDFEQVQIRTQEIPDDTDILIIGDPFASYTEEALQKITTYLKDGGNAMILVEPEYREVVQPILKSLDIQLTEGILQQKNYGFPPQYILAQFSEKSLQMIPSIKKVIHSKKYISMPSAIGIQTGDSTEYTVNPLLEVKKENTQILVDSLTKPISAHVGITLTKKQHDGKEQRILVFGDADLLSDTEYLESQQDQNSIQGNDEIVPHLFGWLTNNEFPIDIQRSELKDTQVNLGKKGIKTLKLILLSVLPLFPVILGKRILNKRKKG